MFVSVVRFASFVFDTDFTVIGKFNAGFRATRISHIRAVHQIPANNVHRRVVRRGRVSRANDQIADFARHRSQTVKGFGVGFGIGINHIAGKVLTDTHRGFLDVAHQCFLRVRAFVNDAHVHLGTIRATGQTGEVLRVVTQVAADTFVQPNVFRRRQLRRARIAVHQRVVRFRPDCVLKNGNFFVQSFRYCQEIAVRTD